MITAWVYYYDGNSHHFEELTGTSFSSVDPTEWGLPASCNIMLVLQGASFIQAFLDGEAQQRFDF